LKKHLEALSSEEPAGHAKLLWLGTVGELEVLKGKKENGHKAMARLHVHNSMSSLSLDLAHETAEWLRDMLMELDPRNHKPKSFMEFRASYEFSFQDFETFWASEDVEDLREIGLLLL
jgi:hypothetical protein